MPLVLKRLRRPALLHEDAITVTGADDRRARRTRRARPRASTSCARSTSPLKATGGFAILRGNLAPDGCVVKLAGHERRHHAGPARVFDGEEAAMAAVTERRDRAPATSS